MQTWFLFGAAARDRADRILWFNFMGFAQTGLLQAESRAIHKSGRIHAHVHCNR